MDTKGEVNNPLGRWTLNLTKANNFFLERFSLSEIKTKCCSQELANSIGSRSLGWRFLLGLYPEVSSSETWIETANEHWAQFKKLTEKYSLKATRKLDPKIFNPLAPPTEENKQMVVDNELWDIIEKDVIRTFQEYKFFTNPKYWDQMKLILYYWAKEHPLISYR